MSPAAPANDGGAPPGGRFSNWSVVLFLLLIYLAPLGERALIAPDETRYAEIAREIVSTGEWVSPRLVGLRYFEKPPLGYWCTALSLAVFGENEFAVRLPSVLSVFATLVCVWLLARECAPRDRECARMAVFAYGTCGLVFGVGTFVTLDSLFSAAVAASMVFALLGTNASRSRRARIALLMAAGGASGVALLTKGFLGLLLPVVALLIFRARERRLATVARELALATAGLLIVALPPALLIHAHESGFWSRFLWEEHVARFFSGEKKHPEPWWFFVPVILLGCLPWSPLVASAVRAARGAYTERGVRFAVIWFSVTFLAVSASSGKLGTYILPAIPPFAVLTALAIRRRPGAEPTLRWVCAAVLVASVVALLGVSASAVLRLASDERGWWELAYTDEEWRERWAGVVLALGLVVLSIGAVRAASLPQRMQLLGGAFGVLSLAYSLALPAAVIEAKSPEMFLRSRLGDLPSGVRLVTDAGLAPAMAWCTRRTDLGILGDGGELAMGLEFPDALGRRFPLESIAEELTTAARPTVVLRRRRDYEAERAWFPTPDASVESKRWVLLEYRNTEGRGSVLDARLPDLAPAMRASSDAMATIRGRR